MLVLSRKCGEVENLLVVGESQSQFKQRCVPNELLLESLANPSKGWKRRARRWSLWPGRGPL